MRSACRLPVCAALAMWSGIRFPAFRYLGGWRPALRRNRPAEASSHRRTLSPRLTDEFPHGQPPTVALINGHPVHLKVTDTGGLYPGVPALPPPVSKMRRLVLRLPASSSPSAGPTPARTSPPGRCRERSCGSSLDRCVKDVAPFIEDWLGSHPRSQLTLLDLPDPQDAPYETGALLAASLHEARGPTRGRPGPCPGSCLYPARPTEPPPAWLSEGIATFMESVWTEKRQGRERALGMLEADRALCAGRP